MMRMGCRLMAILAPLQLFIGDQHGLNTLEHQPIKIAAMEAHWDGSKPGALVLFAWPDEKAEKNLFEISIPHGASLILRHRSERAVSRPEERAAAGSPAGAQRVLRLPHHGRHRPLHDRGGVVRRFLWWRGTLFETRWYLRIVSMTWWSGFVAVIAGWVVTESGRQPWLVHGILRTADAISPVPAASLLGTLALFVICLRHRVLDGHLLHQPADQQGTGGSRDRTARGARPSRPLSAAEGRRARSHRTERVSAMEWYLPVIWAGADRHRRRDVCDPRRLRSRHRHPVSVRAKRERSATR